MADDSKEREVDERLVVLETKVAYQDQIIEELNSVVVRQQDQVDVLTAAVRKLHELAEQLAPDGVEPGEEPPPPHY